MRRWLLIFDNAEHREDVEPYVPRRHTGHVLITSREPDWHPLAKTIPVRPLPRPDAIALLRGDQEWGDEAEADRLAEALGDLPLALAQAAAYVRETASTFASYLEELRTRRAAFDPEQRAESGYGRTVAATLALALDKLREASQEGPGPAEGLLARIAFYAPDRIPRDLLADEFPDTATLASALRTLRHYALVETDADTVTVHRLVQQAVLDRLTPEEQAEHAEHAVRRLAARFPSAPDDVRTWPECRRLLDHARHATDHATRCGQAMAHVAVLLNRIGIHLTAVYDLPGAKEQLQRAHGDLRGILRS